MASETSKCHIVAVIDIGTIAIRMVVAEVGSKNEIRYLENLQKTVRFGKDVFTTRRLSSQSMREGISILKDFKLVLDTYGVTRVHAVATSAVREALNRDNFIDQIYVRTGLDVEILDGPEENRLELIAVDHALEDKIDLANKNCLIVEVGSGSTELILMKQGQVEVARTLPLGSVRLPEEIEVGKTDIAVMQRVLKRNIRDVVMYAAREYNLNEVDTFIALGGDMRFLAHQLIDSIEDRYVELDKKAVSGFVTRISKMTPEEITKEAGIPYAQAETLYAALLYYLYFLNETKVEKIIVPMISIRDGLLLEMSQLLSGYKRTDLSKQVLNSARHLSEKYQYDKTHATCVAGLAVKLFDAMQVDHGLKTRERLLLEVSAILHDIGTFISPSSHHKHSSYIIDASDIFGLRKSDKNIVSNVVRYHRRALPKLTHVPYVSLSKQDRATVSKLAAILRVADALDHSHQQKIRQFTLKRSEQGYFLWIDKEVGDIALERESLKLKGKMFSDVFGAPIQLRQGVPTK